MSEKLVRANDVLKVRKELDKRKNLEQALRNLLSAEYGKELWHQKQTEHAIQTFFEGRLKIWYCNGWLTFTESNKKFE